MGEHSSHQAACYMRGGVHNGEGVHPIKHAFAEWHIARVVTRKSPIFRPMSRTFKLPAGVTRWNTVPSRLKNFNEMFSPRYSRESSPPFPKRNSLTRESKLLRTRQNRMFVGLRKKREREGERKKEEKEEFLEFFSIDRPSIPSRARFITRCHEPKKFFSFCLMIYIFFSSHFITNDKRLWEGKSDRR